MTRRTRRVRSTEAEPSPADPVTIKAAIGSPSSTGAEPFHDGPVTTRLAHLDEPVVVQSPTPGPVTMTVGWLADAESKVIEPAKPARPAPARTQAHTKTTRVRGRSGDN